MNLNLFKNDPLYSEVLEYWVSTWDSITDELSNGTFGIEIINIRIVLSDIINEYTLEKIIRDNNRKVYIHLIERLLKEKHMQSYQKELRILKNKLEERDYENTYKLAEKLDLKIASEVFSNVLFEDLLKIINKKKFDKKIRIRIRKLTKDIIIDLITSGTQISDLKQAINIFLSIPFEESDIKKHIRDLSIEKRLELFKRNLNPQNYEYLFVFPIWGIIAPTNEKNQKKILEFLLYNPSIDKKFKNQSFDELFTFMVTGDPTPYVSKCNAYIIIKANSINLAIEIAKEKYLSLLNLLKYNFNHSIKRIFSDGKYFVVRTDGSSNLSDYPPPSDLMKELSKKVSRDFPFEFTDEKLYSIEKQSSVIDSLNQRGMLIELKSIINVIELMEKAISESPENKLLNYWICLETLANISKKDNQSDTFDFIKETISNKYFLAEQFMPISRAYSFYINYLQDVNDESSKDFIYYLGVILNHYENNSLLLSPFYKGINELPSKIKNELFLDMVRDKDIFYKNNNTALMQMTNKKKEVELTITYIYRSRNQLVHNGYVAKHIIPYLVKFAEIYTKSLFQTIMSVYSNDNFDLQNYFIEEKRQKQLLEDQLSRPAFFKIEF